MTQNDPAIAVQQPIQVTVPYRELSVAEWNAVPRTIPTWILGLASWIPLVWILFWFLRNPHTRPVLSEPSFDGPILAAVALVVWGLAAGRVAPWCAALVTGLLYLTSQQVPVAQATILAGATGYFVLLGLAGNLSGARFASQLRRWRHETPQSLTLTQSELARPRARSEVSSGLLRIASGTMAYGIFRLLLDFFGAAQRELGSLNPENFRPIFVGAVGVSLWLVLLLIRWAIRGYVGQLVLRVPVQPGGNSAIRFGAIAGVMLRAEAEAPGCRCPREAAKTGAADEPYLASFVKVNDDCAVHGIAAINQLPASEAARLIDRPWLVGEHVADQLVRGGTSIPVLGLTGWGSRPVRLVEQQLAPLGSEGSPAPHIYPYRVREVLRRQSRNLRWRSMDNQALETVSWEAQAPAEKVIDRIPLQAQGIPGSLVRVAGQRPYLDPANP